MHVQVIINNDVTRDRVSDNLSAAKSSLWNENYGNALRIDQNHKSLDVRVNRSLIATARLCHRPQRSNRCTKLPQKKYCYTRQPGDNIRQVLKETEQLSEPKTPIVDTENNIVDFVQSQKIAQHGPVLSKSDSHNAISPSAGVAVATLPVAGRSNATGASAPSA